MVLTPRGLGSKKKSFPSISTWRMVKKFAARLGQKRGFPVAKGTQEGTATDENG